MIVSVVRPALASFLPNAEGLRLNGANLADARALRAFANADGVEALEVFLLPREMLPIDRLAALADSILDPERRGQGRLRFHALHNLPAVWADAAPRLLFCQDLYLLNRERYLRDRFARGPIALLSDVHCLGHRDIWASFRDLAAMEHVPYDRIVATSRSLESGIQASFEFLDRSAPETIVFPRAVDTEKFCPVGEEAKRFARRALGLSESVTIALYLSRLTPNDKADLLPLIDAFADVAGKDDLLLIAGSENSAGYADALRRRAAERNVRVEVRTDVPRGGQPVYFAAADLFVFPGDTIQEAVPTAVAEAAACGLPVVASDWDGIRDIVEHSVTGLLVPTALGLPPEELAALFPASDFITDFLFMGQSVSVDRQALGSAIAQLLRDSALRAEMGKRGRAFAERHLGLKDWTPKMVALGKDLLAQAAREPVDHVERRRAAAERSLRAMPFAQIFRGYATETIEPNDAVRLTADGHKALQGKATPSFYDACLPHLTPLVVPTLLRAVESEGCFGKSVDRAAAEAGISPEWTRFALLLLVKHGYVQRS